MPSGIDHIVMTVNDLDEATRSFENLGFTVTFGGHHEHRPSSNLLIPFSDSSYIELIGFRPHPDPIVDPWWDLHQKGEGLVDFALRTDRVADDIARLTAAGIDVRGPVSGGRTRPDGVRIDWQVARVATEQSERLPFIIEDLTSISLRIPSGTAATHANGIDRIIGVTVLVVDLDAAMPGFALVTGDQGERFQSPLDPAAPAARFRVGSHWIELVQPVDPEIRGALSERGPGPYQFHLGAGSASDSDVQIVHGARIRLPSR